VVKCPKCGSSCPDGAVFCGVCGAGLSSHGTVPGRPLTDAVSPIPAPAAPPAPHPLPGPPIGAPLLKPRGPLPVGTIIDQKYAVVRVLGEGGMGVVYLARDIHTGLDVVVKAIRAELAHRADVRQRTLAEGRALAQIDHPNVVHLKAVVVDGQGLWLVMQYIDGESLDKTIAGYVERGERMPVDEALATLRQIAAGLAAAHQEGVIHRDMKPANVLMRRKDGMAKVTDFGIAKVPGGDSREQTKGILGSLWYMSPEQVTGRRDLDKRVDIYALGIVLYQMLAGEVPFDAESDYEIMRRHAEAPMPRVAAKRPDVPPAVDEIIQKACAKDRGQRFQSCEELIAAIDHATVRPARTLTIPESPLPPIESALQTASTASSHDEPSRAHSRAGTTGQGAELTPRSAAPAKSRSFLVVLGLIVVLGGGGAVIALGLIPGVGLDPPRKGSTDREGLHPSASATTSAAPAPPPPPAKQGIELLEGPWSVNGKDLDAVLVGDVLEFRVRAPAQFEPQGYAAGEARFTLRDTAEPDVFAVEDRIRPIPPLGKSYTPASRNTCQESWTSAGGAPLRARGDAKRLSVDLAKIEPSTSNFTMSGSSVTECRGLRTLPVARLVNTLVRQ
jgi:eukaryotic-like serine/threonine-protein kinase